MLGSHTAGTSGAGNGEGNGPPTDGNGGEGSNPDTAHAGAQTDAPGGDNAGGDGAMPASGGDGSNNGGTSNAGSSSGSSAMGGSSNGGSNNGGSANGGSSTAGSNDGGTGNGAAGMGGSGGAPFVSPCGDLNGNRVDDCEETLVKNSRFNSEAANWDPENNLEQHWDPTNATGGSGSGALLVSNNNVIAGLGLNTARASRQCLYAWGGQQFDVAARVLVKSGQGKGEAAVNVVFYAGDNCTGDVVDGATVGAVSQVDTWQAVAGRIAVPAASRSMYVRLLATKPYSQASLQALFDDVLVSEHK